MGRKLRCSVFGSLGVVLTTFVVAFVSPGVASAASATITSISPSSSDGLNVTTSVTVSQSEACTTYESCVWDVEVTAAPDGQSCTTYDATQVVGRGLDYYSPGTVHETITATTGVAAAYEICVFADLPTQSAVVFLADTIFSVPPPTGSVSIGAFNSSEFGGTISVRSVLLRVGCLTSWLATEEDGPNGCSSGISGTTIWQGVLCELGYRVLGVCVCAAPDEWVT